jgi:hypothetical protein
MMDYWIERAIGIVGSIAMLAMGLFLIFSFAFLSYGMWRVIADDFAENIPDCGNGPISESP